MRPLFHIVSAAVWSATVGEYRPASLAQEGFIHFSFADQVAATANERFFGVLGLCVLEIDPTRLNGEVRVEDSYGKGIAYPHLYGPLPAAAVVATHRLDPRADGSFTFAATGPALSDQ